MSEHWCYLCGVQMTATTDGWICPICGAKTYLTNSVLVNKRSWDMNIRMPWEEDCGQTFCTSSVETLGKWMVDVWNKRS